MKTVSKRIIIYILVGFISCSSVSSIYYTSVHAMEWVGGALAFEEALKWLLGAIGIISVGGATADYWENHADEFEEYCADQNITNQEVAEWQMKLCSGVLDKASDCWDAFKGWASNLETGLPSVGSFGTVSEMNTLLNTYNKSTVPTLSDNTYANNPSYGGFIVGSGWGPRQFILLNNVHVTVYNLSGQGMKVRSDNGEPIYCLVRGNNNILNYSDNISISSFNYWGNVDCYYYGNVTVDNTNNSFTSKNIIDILSGSIPDTGDDSLRVVNKTITTTNIYNYYTVDEDDPEVSIPMPGQVADDDTISSDIYDEIINQVNEGEITPEEAVERIQEITKVLVYDTVTDDVIPNITDPDTGENKKKDDVIKENKNNMGFTLGGLENVFPFCIPWDIYAFMNLLVAEPVAPSFTFPIKSVNNQTENITIDLSPFEPVAVVVRYCFDFLFIIGLGILTRSLIGGGSSD